MLQIIQKTLHFKYKFIIKYVNRLQTTIEEKKMNKSLNIIKLKTFNMRLLKQLLKKLLMLKKNFAHGH